MDGQGYNYYRAPNAPGGGGSYPNPRNVYYGQQQNNGYYTNQSTHFNSRNQSPRQYSHGGVGPPQNRNIAPQYHPQYQYYQGQNVPMHQPQPQQLQHHQRQQHPQQRLQEQPFKLSAEAAEFVPSSFMTPRDPQFGGGASGSSHYRNSSYGAASNHLGDDDEDALLQLQMFITDVTLSPAVYESRVYDLTDFIFQELTRLPQNTEQIVKTIFEAGLLQQNFRYSGARLCDYLANLVVVQGKSIFRDHLLSHLYKFVGSSKPVVGDKEQDKDNRGIALFCAELFSQLDISRPSDLPEAYANIGPLYVDILEALILSMERENQKHAIQALKLCGGILEELCRDTDKMDKLLETCSNVEKKEGIDSIIQSMLARLPKTRESNWGYKPREKTNVDYGSTQVDFNEPVMYGPDGVPINAEELNFLNSGLNGDYGMCAGGAGDYGGYMQQTIMDDEALDDYEQFLRETGQK